MMLKWRRVRAGAYISGKWAVLRVPTRGAMRPSSPWRVWHTDEMMARKLEFKTAREAKTYCEAQ